MLYSTFPHCRTSLLPATSATKWSAPQATFHAYYSFDLLLFVFRTCSIGLPISSATRFGFNVPGSDCVFPPHTNNFPSLSNTSLKTT